MSHLTYEQRYTISNLTNQGFHQKFIAEIVHKDKSVISRELKRNCNKRSGKYDGELAQRKYKKRMKDKPKRLTLTHEIKDFISQQLENKLSPEQITGYARKLGKSCVSPERIYQHIYEDKKDKGQLYKHLRTEGKRYRKRGNTKDRRGIIKERVDISHRPKIVENKERFGDLEIDTMIGKNHKGALITINDRATGLVKIKKIDTREAKLLSKETIQILSQFQLPIHTITSDNGKEFAEHQSIAKALNIKFFFAQPYHFGKEGLTKI